MMVLSVLSRVQVLGGEVEFVGCLFFWISVIHQDSGAGVGE